MQVRRLVGTILALALAATVAVGAAAPGARADATDPTRILLLGDSITQGSAGDYTWRYRLWTHLDATAGPIDLVGPRNDLFENVSAVQGSQGYVDPAFDTDHASRWGMSLAFQDWPTSDLMSTYAPDVVIELLGLNDLTWLKEQPAQVDVLMRQLVADARAANPSVAVVLSRLPSINFSAVPAMNEAISAAAADLTTAESPVVVAAADDGFVPFEDTWDSAHPNARGEVKIAAAVSDALAQLGIGTPYPRPLPDVPIGPRLAPTASVTAGEASATVTWFGSPGSTAEYLWVRDETADGAWTRLPDQLTGTSTVVSGLTNWHTYGFLLQPVKGNAAAADDVRSALVEATPMPRAPGPVTTLTATVTGTSARLSWTAADSATGYRVAWRNATAATDWTDVPGLTTTTSTTIANLVPGRTYEVHVQPTNDGVLGAWSPTASVSVKPVKPPAPTGLTAVGAGSGAVRLSWNPLRVATEFRVFTRDVTRNTAWRRVAYPSLVTGTAATVSGLRVGDLQAFRIRAVCVTVSGPWSTVATLKVPRARAAA